MIDFEWYRSFIAIYKTGSVSEAAKTRFLTQPAMSQHLAALEAKVGYPLFKRTPRKMIPTEEGKKLYSRLVPYIEGLENISNRLDYEKETEKPLVRLGVSVEYFIDVVLEKLVETEFRFHVGFGTAPTLLEQLKTGNYQIVITSQKLMDPSIEYIHLEEEEFVLVGSDQMEFFEIDSEDGFEEWLCNQNWISYGPELPIIRRFWKQYFRKRPNIEPAWVIPDLRAISKAILLNTGISLLPYYLVKDQIKSGKLKQIGGAKYAVKNDLWIAFRIMDRESVFIEELTNLLKG